MERKEEVSNIYEYGAKYCFDIISWNLKHLSCSNVVVDNLTCFEPLQGVYGSASIFFNPNKNELTFRCNFIQHFITTEIINKKKYKIFSRQEFMNHFIYFYSLIEKVMRLKPIQYCDTCLTPSYKQRCNECYVKSLVTHHSNSSFDVVKEKKSKKQFFSFFRKK